MMKPSCFECLFSGRIANGSGYSLELPGAVVPHWGHTPLVLPVSLYPQRRHRPCDASLAVRSSSIFSAIDRPTKPPPNPKMAVKTAGTSRVQSGSIVGNALKGEYVLL